MGHVSSHASVKMVFPAPVKWLLWAVKGPLLFMICKNPLQQLLAQTFSAAASSCRQELTVLQLAESVNAPSTSPFFQLTTHFVPLRFFVPLCSRRATRKACAAVEPRLFAWPRQRRARRLLYPLLAPQPLTVHSSGEAHSAPCPQRWRPPRPSPPMPHQRPRTPAALLPPPPHPRCRSRKRRKRVSDETPPNTTTTTTATKKWPLVFLVLFFLES